ncbi:MAG: cytochrome c biogenesis protein CcsA [Chloroflexota bacterium]
MNTQQVKTDQPIYSPNRTRLLNALTVATTISIVLAFALALFYAGTDQQQGQVQRIFYIHISAFVGGSTAFLITVLAGIAYLRTRAPKWDALAVSSVEVGLPLMTITLVTGMTWARPIWNTWWTGDPRLNSMAVMWLLYAAYLTLRGAIESPERRMRYAAIYGIFAFVSVIYVFIVIRIRPDTLHPVVLGPSPVESTAKGSFGVQDPRMILAMSVNMIAWMLVPITLIWHRVRMENVAEQVRALKMRLLNQ